ncbi:uncharacterized protein OCT59_000928 [Rhizophagus irregularis]|uniref:B30.2/SPRY domain-containing protein n=1 Tax=Rhizophagus irregularis (strain DAOM 197198w) TaxID=1432141 RepID=A0A015LK93_RHIIW|nr:hypothetical protein RirG_227530 [Rhizophagus irregularis DAOM 197198w]UZN99661.1 hypothetical protein OCT59_000928 [Rhizophagus irregularis]
MGSVRAKVILENNGIYEWDVIIEKECIRYSVGVCDSEKFNYGVFAGDQPNACVLDSYGLYLINFGNTKITVHLDMNKRTCIFTIDGTMYSEVSTCNNLSSKLYPVVSLYYPGRFRIQSHQKRI